MKKILLLISFFFFIPIIKAEETVSIQMINSNISVIKTANKVTNWGEIEDTNLESVCASPNLRKPLQ